MMPFWTKKLTFCWIFCALMGEMMAQLPVLPAPTPEIAAAERAWLAVRNDTSNWKNVFDICFQLEDAYVNYFKPEYAKYGLLYARQTHFSKQTVNIAINEVDSLKAISQYNPYKVALLKTWVNLKNTQITNHYLELMLHLFRQNNQLAAVRYREQSCSVWKRLGDTTTSSFIAEIVFLADSYETLFEDYTKSIYLLEAILPAAQMRYDVFLSKKIKCDTLQKDFYQMRDLNDAQADLTFANVLHALGNVYTKTGKWSKAEPLYRQSINIFEKVKSLVVYDDTTRFKINTVTRERQVNTVLLSALKAIQTHHHLMKLLSKQAHFNDALIIWDKLNDKMPNWKQDCQSNQYAVDVLNEIFQQTWNTKIEIAFAKGDYRMTRELIRVYETTVTPIHDYRALHRGLLGEFKEALSINANRIKQDELHPEKAINPLSHLLAQVGFFILLGDMNQAQKMLDKAHLLIQQNKEVYSNRQAELINYHAIIAAKNGQHLKALSYSQTFLNLQKTRLPPISIEMAREYSSLADTYLSLEMLDSAKFYYNKTLQIHDSIIGKQHREYHKNLRQLAKIAYLKQDYPLAENTAQQVVEFVQAGAQYSAVDAFSIYQAIIPILLANNKIEKARFYQKKAWNMRWNQIKDSTESQLLENYRYNIQITESQGNSKQNAQNIKNWLELMRRAMKTRFEGLSDNEKTQFMEALNQEFGVLSSILSRNQLKNAPEAFYDMALLQKSIVLSDNKGFQKRMWALREKDTIRFQDAFKLFQNMKTLNNENTDLSERAKLSVETDSLRTILNKTAPELFQTDWDKTTWRDVQKLLKENEVAIEIIDFQYHTQTVPTDSIVYYAAVVRKGDAQPTMIRLFEEKQLMKYLQSSQEITTEIHVDSLYITNSGALYELIWQPFENAGLLKEGNTVYLSPSGQLNRIALTALMKSGTLNKRFRDLYRLEMVNSTREILVEAKDKTLRNNDLSALLVGGVIYDADSAALHNAWTRQKNTIQNPQKFTLHSVTPDLDGCNIDFLPHTLTEIQNIYHAIQAKKPLYADTLTGFEASEDAIRAKLKTAPTMVHLSTHGWYRLPENRKLTPMQALHNNFVLLSGCKWATCQRKSNIEDMHDGVLTAAEVADMDLKKTQLVVLSACETGLGDLRGREGVFGLARGFKLAGAKYQLVSLWQVPDVETSEFMQLFYQKSLDGTTIQDAFLETQTELSQKYPNKPYNWAAWVLIR